MLHRMLINLKNKKKHGNARLQAGATYTKSSALHVNLKLSL